MTIMQKKALITGVTGQDGSYLADLLMEKGYDVHGIIRRSTLSFHSLFGRFENNPRFHIHYADLSDSLSLQRVIAAVRPDEIYNLGAQSHVHVSYEAPEFTTDVNATGVLRLLEAVRQSGLGPTCRVYQACTSEIFGKVETPGPQNEETPFHPYSPYGVAKLYSYYITRMYREVYGMFCCSGILYNHESERRSESFVARKITMAAARIAQGRQEKLRLGNLSAKRDWGYARDYVVCIWQILQGDKADDYVIATGVQHSLREFCRLAFRFAGIDLRFEGEGLGERGVDSRTGRVIIEVSPEFYRPVDVTNLVGDADKARRELGCDPAKTPFEEWVKRMVDTDMARVAAE